MRVTNTGRKFGADPEYIYTTVDGSPRLFTEEEDARAAERAEEHYEDLPPLWARVCHWFTIQFKQPYEIVFSEGTIEDGTIEYGKMIEYPPFQLWDEANKQWEPIGLEIPEDALILGSIIRFKWPDGETQYRIRAPRSYGSVWENTENPEEDRS